MLDKLSLEQLPVWEFRRSEEHPGIAYIVPTTEVEPRNLTPEEWAQIARTIEEECERIED